MSQYNVCVVGIGAVGTEMVRLLKRRNFPVKSLVILARTERTETIDGDRYPVKVAQPDAFAGMDFAFFAGTEGAKGASQTLGWEAVKRGCVVIAIDLNPRNLDVARQLGADHLINGSGGKVAEAVQALVPDGADVVFECTGIPACIDQAIPLCRTHGSFVWQGNYGEAPISMHFMPAHMRRLRMFFPCDDGWQPFRRAVVKNMALGVLPWGKTITHRVSAAEAPALYTRINAGDPSVLGAVIKWSE